MNWSYFFISALGLVVGFLLITWSVIGLCRDLWKAVLYPALVGAAVVILSGEARDYIYGTGELQWLSVLGALIVGSFGIRGLLRTLLGLPRRLVILAAGIAFLAFSTWHVATAMFAR